MTLSVRDQVSTILGTINTSFKTLDAAGCIEFANILASLLADIIIEEAEAEGLCNIYIVTILDNAAEAGKKLSMAEAKVRLKTTTEWLSWQKIRAMRLGCEETIRTLKSRVRVMVSEEQEFTPR